jgi:DNA-binding transcriptional ArsR family regulator
MYDDHRIKCSMVVVLDSSAMQLEHPDRADLQLTAVLHALSDPGRLRIVQILAADDEPRRCGSFGLDVSKSTMTHHFRVLREAGVIQQWFEGTSKLSVLRREDLEARFPGLLEAVLAPASAAAVGAA